MVDAFCGVGGNTSQFALHGAHVTAVDVDKRRLLMAKHNAGVYDNAAANVEFVCADFIALARVRVAS